MIVAWELDEENDVEKRAINQALKDALSGYRWVRPLGSVYIVKVESPEDRNALGEALRDVARKNSAATRLIYSPAIEGGRYNGWLPRALWSKIRERAE